MTFKYGIDHLDLDIVNGIAKWQNSSRALPTSCKANQ